MNVNRLTVPQRISLVAVLVTAVAAFLPWVSLFGLSKLGVEGDGVFTLLFAIGGAAVLLLTTGAVGKPRTPGKASQIVVLVLAILTALIALLDMNGVAAIGLYLTLFAGIAWVVGAIWQLTASSSRGAVGPESPEQDSVPQSEGPA